MAKASLKQGYLQLANVLSEQFAARDFTETQHAIIRVVERNTYGYQGREFFTYQARLVAGATGIHVSNIRKAVAALVEANVLLLTDELMGINPHFDEWGIPLRKEVKSTRPEGVKSTREGVKVTPEKELNSLEKEVNLTRVVPPKLSNGAVLQAPKERNTCKNNASSHARMRVEGHETFAGECEWLAEVLKTDDPSRLSIENYQHLRKWLSFPVERREEAVVFTRSQEGVFRPFGFALGYLKHPEKYDWASLKSSREATKPVAPEHPDDVLRRCNDWRRLLIGKGTCEDNEWCRRMAMRAKRGGTDIDDLAMMKMCDERGIAATLSHIWDAWGEAEAGRGRAS